MLKDSRLPDTSSQFRDVTRSSENIHQSSVSRGSHQNFRNYALAIKTEPRRAESSGDAMFLEPTFKGESNISTAQLPNYSSLQEGIRTDASTGLTEANKPDSSSEWLRIDAVPGSQRGKKVFRNAQVRTQNSDSTVWGHRFDYMYTKLEEAVNSDQHLRDDVRLRDSITYNQYMVGTTPETARPSIVVGCRKEYCNDLRSIFLQRFRSQLNFGGRNYLKLLHLETPNQDPDEIFDLVFFCNDANPIDRKASEGTLEAYFDTKATWCGGLAISGSRSSTLGLAVYIPDFLGVLTVDHLFYPPITSSHNQNSESTDLPRENPDTSNQELDINEQRDMAQWLEAADEYDFGDITSQPDAPNTEKLKTNTIQTDPKSDSVTSSHDTMGKRTRWQRVMPMIPLGGKMPYMDWALVRPGMDNETQRLPNIFFPNGPSESSVAFGKVFDGSPTHWAGIYMISGVRGILKGHLLASHSRLGSSLGSHASEAWTVILDLDIDGVLDGECGSLIIDQTSSEVYGHVVACGPLGQVYVSPMKHVMSQIKAYFESTEARAVSDHAFGTYSSAVPESVRDHPEPGDGQGPDSRSGSSSSYYGRGSSSGSGSSSSWNTRSSTASSGSSTDPYYSPYRSPTAQGYPKSVTSRSGVVVHQEHARGYNTQDPRLTYTDSTVYGSGKKYYRR